MDIVVTIWEDTLSDFRLVWVFMVVHIIVIFMQTFLFIYYNLSHHLFRHSVFMVCLVPYPQNLPSLILCLIALAELSLTILYKYVIFYTPSIATDYDLPSEIYNTPLLSEVFMTMNVKLFRSPSCDSQHLWEFMFSTC